jgi:outer membrane protein TolC
MGKSRRCWWAAVALLAGLCASAGAQPPPEMLPSPTPAAEPVGPSAPPVPFTPPKPGDGVKVLPISLPAALQLADARAIDVAIASAQVRVAVAQLDRARVLWLPTVYAGVGYFRHDGQIQDVAGKVFGTSKQSLMIGAGPYAVFALSDAIFAPLAARQTVRAREAGVQAAVNDSFLAAAEAYFTVQQARGELAGAEDDVRRAEQVAGKARELSQKYIPAFEASRVTAELAGRRQALHAARERWATASADLTRVLRLDPGAGVEPLEPPHLTVTLVPPGKPVDELIPIGLTNRPELAAQQALVQAALARLRQERIRPLVPSVLLRGASTPVTGTLAGGVFGGGINDNLNNFSARSDFDVQVLWEWQNLGFGNRARINERRAEHQLSIFELFRAQDRVAAEVAQAYAQVESAAARVRDAESELKDAAYTAEKSYEGLSQTSSRDDKRILLVVRPQEAVAAVQALGQAYVHYYGAVADYNRAQFRLYHALGHPAQLVTGHDLNSPPIVPCEPATPAPAPVPTR